MSLDYSPKLYQVAHERALELRRNQTPSEKLLWQALRGRKLEGYKFHRQHPIRVEVDGRLTFAIADFYCAEAKLIVEVDGSSHEQRQVQDEMRDLATNARGYSVLRVSASDVEMCLPGVLAMIIREIEQCIRTPGT